MSEPSLIRYYIYISQQKVDSLYEQISERKKKKISYEFGVDKIIKFGRKEEVEDSEPNMSGKLNRILSLLNEVGDVGAVDDARTYLSGTLQMFWKIDAQWGFVEFYGQTSKTIVVLAGSARNVIGYEGVTRKVLGSAMEGIQNYFYAGAPKGGNSVRNLVSGVMRFQREASCGLPQHLEFAARELFDCPPSPLSNNRQVVIATPLYVALADSRRQ